MNQRLQNSCTGVSLKGLSIRHNQKETDNCVDKMTLKATLRVGDSSSLLLSFLHNHNEDTG